MKKIKSILVMLLCVILCVLPLASCSEDDPGDETTSDPTASAVSKSPEDEFPHPDYYNDTTIRILCVEKARHIYGELQFVPDEESNFSAINKAVKERNDFIASKYGLKMEVFPTKYPDEKLRTDIQSGDANYDLVSESVDRMLQCVTENMFWSLDGLLDMNHAWWDKTAMDSISIGGKTYFVSGDAIITDDDNTYLYLYNKDIYSNNADLTGDYGDIYELVRSGKFTLDVFTEMCKKVAQPDENGEWGTEATYGNLSSSYSATVMMNGCGIAIASPDPATGYFQLNIMNGESVSAFDKVYKVMSDKHVTNRAELLINKIPEATSKYGFAELEYMFINGRGLFYSTTATSISSLKTRAEGLDFEFGVLPNPKYDEAQEKYYNTVNRFHSTVLGIPVTNEGDQREATCVLMQALGCYSADVTKAYYEQTLQTQALQDDADAEMLDLVYNNRFYDLGAMFGWADGRLVNLYGNAIANDATNQLTSLWQAIQTQVETDMQATVDAYKASLT